MVFTVLASLLVFAGEDRRVMEHTVRKPAVAGQFYTADPQNLRREVERYLEKAGTPDVTGDVVALVSPHAGYMYSGQVAAYGYSLVRGKEFETVVVISPSHVEYFDYCSVFPGKSYLTPLGEIPIDQKVVKLITSLNEHVRGDGRGHLFNTFGRGEHALEVQLPFLQVALGEFKLVPIVMGDQDKNIIEALGNTLGEALKGRNALIVASTDLSHFHADEEARMLDGVFMDELKHFEPDKLYEAISHKKTEACGGGPTAAAMIAARKLGATRCEVLHYANSGDITGDTRNVVGYVSAVMLRERDSGRKEKDTSNEKEAPERSKKGKNNPGDAAGENEDSELSNEDRVFLLKLARSTIEAECSGKKMDVSPPPSPVMDEQRGGFVTLKKKGQLRGCIGYIEAIKPLITTIEEMAKAAAFNDYRFPPVTAEEVPDLEIEISILTPVREIEDPSLIEVGKHGIIITRGMNRGLLLPQVATEWNWDRETFLRQTCLKAGLPEDAWMKEGTKIEIFSAEVFSERELGLR